MDLLESTMAGVDIEENNRENINPDFLYELEPGDKELILQPLCYHNALGGKNIRGQLIEVLNYWMEVPQEKLTEIIDIVDNLHNTTLLIDDIQDYSSLRRGQPAAYTIFGIGHVSNTCGFHFGGIALKVLTLNHPKAIKIHVQGNVDLSCGQGMEIYWRHHSICPTEKEYEDMVLKKTGGVFFVAKDYMQLFATKHVELDLLLKSITLYFQINDDYQNLKSDLFFQSKGFCEDLTEGKFGFPTMHAVNTYPSIGQEIKHILQQRTTDVDTKKYCLSLIESCGSFEYTRNRLEDLKMIIMQELVKLEENPLLKEFLPKLFSLSKEQ